MGKTVGLKAGGGCFHERISFWCMLWWPSRNLDASFLNMLLNFNESSRIRRLFSKFRHVKYVKYSLVDFEILTFYQDFYVVSQNYTLGLLYI